MNHITDLSKIPLRVLEEDISLMHDIDINDINLLELSNIQNQKEGRITLTLNGYSGAIYFDGELVLSYISSHQKEIKNEKSYLEFLSYLASFYSTSSEVIFTLEDDVEICGISTSNLY